MRKSSIIFAVNLHISQTGTYLYFGIFARGSFKGGLLFPVVGHKHIDILLGIHYFLDASCTRNKMFLKDTQLFVN